MNQTPPSAQVQMVDRLVRDHDKMRALAAELRSIFEQPSPPRDLEKLAMLRWDMASTVMSHLAFEDRAFYSRIDADPRPHVHDMAHRFRTELMDLFEEYSRHAKDWTQMKIRADWQSFSQQGLHFLSLLLVRARQEETELFPLVLSGDVDLSTPQPVTVNWAQDAFSVKDVIRNN